MKQTLYRTAPLALAALVIAALPTAAGANLVNNGSFEVTNVTITTQFLATTTANWSNSDIGEALVTPNWFFTGQLFPNVGIAGAFPQTSPDGGNFVLSDGDFHNSPLLQTITGLTPSSVYTLSFYQALAQDTEPPITIPGPVSGRWQVSLGASSQLSAFMTGNGATLTFSPWALQTMTFTATSATEVLSFLSIGAGDPPLLGLDGITLAAAVPEPDSLALIGLGGLLLALKLRHERKAKARHQPA